MYKCRDNVRWKVGDRVMVHMLGTVKGIAWKFVCAFNGPYQVVALTSTNAGIQLVDKPKESTCSTIFVALECLHPCPGELKNVSWTGHNTKRAPQSSQCLFPLRQSNSYHILVPPHVHIPDLSELLYIHVV